MALKPAHRSKLIRVGRKFGYPSCCIKHFVMRMEWSPSRLMRYHRTHSHNRMGYVPCPKCSPAIKAFVACFRREMDIIMPRRIR